MVQADVWLRTRRWCRRPTSAWPPPKRRTAFSTPPRCRARLPPTSRRRKNLYAMLTGRITSLAGDARINAGGRSIRAAGPLARRGPHARVQPLRRRFVAHEPDRHPERPACATCWPTRSIRPTTATRRSPKRPLRRSGVGNLFMPGTLTGTGPGSWRIPAGTYAYNADRNNFAPSLGFAWQLPTSDNMIGKLLMGSEQGDASSAPARRWRSSGPACRTSPARSAPTRASRSTLTRDSTNATLPILLRNKPGAAGRAGGHAADRADRDHQQRQLVRPEHPDAVHAVVVGRAGSAS